MQSVSWLAFGSSNALSHTVVHFFPSSGTVSAPYPARCKFRLFGQGETGKSVTIEGPRLSHPDGVRLDQVFPSLSDGVNGFLGMEVSLVAVQPRVDLTPSLCMVELSSRAISAKFVPTRLVNREIESRPRKSELRYMGHQMGLMVQDDFAKGSIVVVNGTGNAVDIPIRVIESGDGKATENANSASLGTASLGTVNQGAYSVSEIPLSPGKISNLLKKQCSWGVANIARIELADELPTGTACYCLHRDASTNLPVSVSAL